MGSYLIFQSENNPKHTTSIPYTTGMEENTQWNMISHKVAFPEIQ